MTDSGNPLSPATGDANPLTPPAAGGRRPKRPPTRKPADRAGAEPKTLEATVGADRLSHLSAKVQPTVDAVRSGVDQFVGLAAAKVAGVGHDVVTGVTDLGGAVVDRATDVRGRAVDRASDLRGMAVDHANGARERVEEISEEVRDRADRAVTLVRNAVGF